MELTESQKQILATWLEAGDSLAEIQRKLREEMNHSLTYMEVRFLVDDLGMEIREEEKPDRRSPSDDLDSAEVEDSAAELVGEGAGADDFAGPDGDGGGSKIPVEVDKLTRPGAVMSGTVQFTDGVKANWQIDQLGRLAVIAPEEGYQPPADDLPSFQKELQRVLQRQGF